MTVEVVKVDEGGELAESMEFTGPMMKHKMALNSTGGIHHFSKTSLKANMRQLPT